MSPYDLAIAPFVEFEFMRRALVATSILSVSACPLGVFLMLRRMSLAGDVMAHALLPGAAVGFMVSGLDVLPMAFGGLAAGLVVALLSGAASRATILKEDASLAAFYLISLALGVLLVSLQGSSEDLVHVLFGGVSSLGGKAIALMAGIAAMTIAALALIWRALAADSVDPLFLRSVSRVGPYVHLAFLVLVVLNLVGGFQALGTLLGVGLMMLPAIAARLWTADLRTMAALAAGIGVLSGAVGLLMSHHLGVESGPAIILAAGATYVVSLVFGRRGLIAGRLAVRHRTA